MVIKKHIKQPSPPHMLRRYKRLELLQYIKAGWSKEKTAQHHGITVQELEEALKEPGK